MTRRRLDSGIIWVVLFAAVFWVAVWQHEALGELYRKSPIPGGLRWIESFGHPQAR
jgi:hypothetical protein